MAESRGLSTTSKTSLKDIPLPILSYRSHIAYLLLLQDDLRVINTSFYFRLTIIQGEHYFLIGYNLQGAIVVFV
jgi:hypothetical protein